MINWENHWKEPSVGAVWFTYSVFSLIALHKKKSRSTVYTAKVASDHEPYYHEFKFLPLKQSKKPRLSARQEKTLKLS
jgi:hypothetical protein